MPSPRGYSPQVLCLPFRYCPVSSCSLGEGDSVNCQKIEPSNVSLETQHVKQTKRVP